MQPTTVASPKPGRNAEGGKYIERRDRLRENNIKPAEAAEILGVSPQFIRVAMQMGQLPIGIAIKLPGSSEYTYQISDNLLQQRTSKNVAEIVSDTYPKEKAKITERVNKKRFIGFCGIDCRKCDNKGCQGRTVDDILSPGLMPAT